MAEQRTSSALAESSSAPLPPGWAPLRHERHDIDAFYHAASRVCCWTRPYVCKLSDVEAHSSPESAKDAEALIDALCTSHANERQHLAQQLHKPKTWEEHLELDLQHGHARCMPYADFVFQQVDHEEHRAHLTTISLFRQYVEGVFGARFRIDVERLPEGGQWEQRPPHEARAIVLGVTVAKAQHSIAHVARGLAAEAALLRLCPKLYLQTARRIMGSAKPILRPVIVDPAVMETLAVDDP